MKRSVFHRFLSIISCVSLIALLGALLPLPVPAYAAPATPQVTVYLKNYLEEYNLATTEFLAEQFDDLDSPAYGLVSYRVVTTTLTAADLNSSVALVIDESADMSLTAGEAAVIHSFVHSGGRVGLFAFPRYYWDHEGPNPAAYQAIADIWGVSAVGEPAASGALSADVVEPADSSLAFTSPYTITEGTVVINDSALPFSPVTAAAAVPVLVSPVSPAPNPLPGAVVNAHGIFVTEPIGDAVQGGDANDTYHQFVVNAIVWLTTGGTVLQNHYYLPMMSR